MSPHITLGCSGSPGAGSAPGTCQQRRRQSPRHPTQHGPIILQCGGRGRLRSSSLPPRQQCRWRAPGPFANNIQAVKAAKRKLPVAQFTIHPPYSALPWYCRRADLLKLCESTARLQTATLSIRYTALDSWHYHHHSACSTCLENWNTFSTLQCTNSMGLAVYSLYMAMRREHLLS